MFKRKAGAFVYLALLRIAIAFNVAGITISKLALVTFNPLISSYFVIVVFADRTWDGSCDEVSVSLALRFTK